MDNSDTKLITNLLIEYASETKDKTVTEKAGEAVRVARIILSLLERDTE